MNKLTIAKHGSAFFAGLMAILVLGPGFVLAQDAIAPAKKLLIPDRISRVPRGNDFTDNKSDFSFKRKVEGKNVAIFWHKEYGDDPTSNPNQRRRFEPDKMLRECERFYETYVTELEVVKKGKSISDNHKLLVFVIGGESGTAFGGGIDNRVAALWTPATRVNRAPYGVLAHEMGHSFQFMSRVDSRTGARGAIGEMSAQYMLWQVYPAWMTFENYHLKDFMKKTHFAFLHPTNMYHSPYVLEYWSDKHGKKHYGDLNRATRRGDDVVATYKRMHQLDQEAFNNEMFDACRRFVTWDLKRIEPLARRYANQHKCKLKTVDNGWLQIAPSLCPQNYGYNAIRMEVPKSTSKVEVIFKGLTEAEGFDIKRPDEAGWRYGFVAYLDDHQRVYGKTYQEKEGDVSFDVPPKTEYLWFVVMGAPAEHRPVSSSRSRRGSGSGATSHWPYQFKVKGTEIHRNFVERPR